MSIYDHTQLTLLARIHIYRLPEAVMETLQQFHNSNKSLYSIAHHYRRYIVEKQLL